MTKNKSNVKAAQDKGKSGCPAVGVETKVRTNIKKTNSGLVEKSTGRKVESPLDVGL